MHLFVNICKVHRGNCSGAENLSLRRALPECVEHSNYLWVLWQRGLFWTDKTGKWGGARDHRNPYLASGEKQKNNIIGSWNYKNCCRFIEKIVFPKNRRLSSVILNWFCARGTETYLWKYNENCLPIMFNQLSQLEENRVCARWHVLSAQIDKGLQMKTNKTNNWVWVCLCNKSFNPPWDMCRMMTDLVMPTRSRYFFLKLILPKK